VAKSANSTVRAMRDADPGLPRRPVWILAATPVVVWMLLLYVSPVRAAADRSGSLFMGVAVRRLA
jgi:hypothetical protein